MAGPCPPVPTAMRAIVRASSILGLAMTAPLIVSFWMRSLFTFVDTPGAYPGIDAEEHIGYARTLVEDWRVPTSDELRNYYTPPGFFLLAGAAFTGLDQAYLDARRAIV